MSKIFVILYYKGRIYDGNEGVTFEGEKKTIQIERGIGYDNLKKLVHSRLKLEQNQSILALSAKLLVEENPKKYISYDLNEDSDIDCTIDLFKESSLKALEIYVQLHDSCSSTALIPTNVNNELQIANINYNSESDEDWEPDMGDDNTENEEEANFSYVNSSDSEDEEGNLHHATSQARVISAIPVQNVNPEISDLDYGSFPEPSPFAGYIDWDHPDQEMDFEGLDVPGSWRPGDELYVGLRFISKEAVQGAVKHYSMKRHQSFMTVDSKPTILYLRCPKYKDGCPWKMRAILPKNKDMWVIKTWGGPHTCVHSMLSQDHPKLDSEFIASYILGLIRKEPSTTMSAIQEVIKTAFGYSISYKKAWVAKQKAIEKAFGDWDNSYAMLPAWMENMLLYAPGSYYKLETIDCFPNEPGGSAFRKFDRLFWTFKQCCDAFKYCKPIIQIDGTFLYGKYRGTLLIATSQDGNSQVVPLAFAIVEGETLSAWEWFLALIRLHVTNKRGLSLISDRHRSIISAVANEALGWQPPHAYHVFCVRHIASNFNTKFKNKNLKELLKRAGYSCCKEEFDRRLERVVGNNEEIKKWIDDIPKEKWVLAFDEHGRRYGHLTTNLSECVNQILKGARNLPITALVRFTYIRLVEYFIQRGSQARAEFAAGQVYTQALRKAFDKIQEKASAHQVRQYDFATTRFQVEEAFDPVKQTGGRTYCVDLQNKVCECGRFQVLHYPCSHVLAACSSWSLRVDQFVDNVYKLQSVINVYSENWFPIQNEHLVPSMHVVPFMLLPNNNMLRNKKGRPRSTRMRNEMDWIESPDPRQRQRCGYCSQVGHNRKRCPQRASGSGSQHVDEQNDVMDL